MTRTLYFWLLLIGLLAPLVPAPVAAQNLIIVPISEIDGSGVIGDASLIDNGDGTTTVDILLAGVTGGHAAVVQAGSCDNLDEVLHKLDSVRQDGTSVTDLEVTLDDLVEELPMAVVIRRSSASNATVIACGDVDASDRPPSVPGSTAQPTLVPSPTPEVTPTPDDESDLTPTPTPDPGLPTCQDFDAWAWAQTIFEEDREANAQTLDPDGNGIACEELPVNGFAPALWTEEMPEGLTPVQATGFYSGDAFQILVNGQLDVVRLRGVAAPLGDQCGYASSGSFLAFVLGIAPNFVVYLDYQNSPRDDLNRLVADVWFEYADDPYLVNEVMIRNGYGWSIIENDVEPLKDEFEQAQEFAADHLVGVHLECGGFGLPTGSTPTPEQLALARERQPNQGQFGP